MGPIIIEINSTKALLNAAKLFEKEYTEVNIKELILRPLMKKIIFVTEEFNRIIVYEGDADFEAHKNDSDNVLIDALLAKIDTLYKV